MKTAFIGDIHGCIIELRSVIRQALLTTDHIVFLGDYVDRGMDSRLVIEELVQLQARFPARTTFLQGNHDLAFLKALDGDGEIDDFLKMGGAKTIRSYLTPPFSNSIKRFRADVPESHRSFLRSLKPAYFERGLVAVHDARLAPDSGAFVVSGHITQAELIPKISETSALIDTGCGTVAGGRLTCFVWPTQEWWQSDAWL
ncbi:hypothetical protein B7R54_00255 [Subtercola boreus]|uniref:Calcineurin-like phosphoesterase domain-containing protein n=1 Tax=Subtercola boreus TaxID=120213 RepID=A0A3E0VDT0_9MICO|nr:hypothetical protein B7R54_00255 [Subtercola boreus]TQL55338.1 calcineurin-like phosphoesterase family protein [Subtercola boreus]